MVLYEFCNYQGTFCAQSAYWWLKHLACSEVEGLKSSKFNLPMLANKTEVLCKRILKKIETKYIQTSSKRGRLENKYSLTVFSNLIVKVALFSK